LKELEKENTRLKNLVADLSLDNAILKEVGHKCPFNKVISPARRRQAVEHVQQISEVSERRACQVIGQPRSTQRYSVRLAEDGEILTVRIITLASQYGRDG
jgi:hypothetical protein